MLRIDDTDTERNKEEHVDVIHRTMAWLNLDYDMYTRQSAHGERYAYCVKRLMEAGLAVEIEGGAVALLMDKAPLREQWHDELAGNIRITDTDRQHTPRLVLVRSGGGYTYNFTTVVDDRDYGINYIIRGVDHISNTAKQLAVWDSLDLCLGAVPVPKFAHVGLITKDGKKMSKRDGAASMLYYEDKKYNPEALLNFMLRLGWGPKQDDKTTALLPRERALALFLEGGRMRNAPAAFDQAKLDSFQRKYSTQGK
jgi:glutamyl-tRNA synthetase